MFSLALLGDSIFDNKAYVGQEPDVAEHLSRIAPSWQVHLLAVDGSLVQNVMDQLGKVDVDTSHLIVSAGGNDAIMNADVLQMPASNSAEVLNVLANRSADFEVKYNQMLDRVVSHGVPTAVCTIYYPNFEDRVVQKIAVAALSVFNDAIIRSATIKRLPILDLRLVCNEKDDYANEIEPSGKGGQKIAEAIKQLIERHDFTNSATQIYY